MNNDYMKSYGFLGIGQFGTNVTKSFEEVGYPCVVANSSTEDLMTRNAKNKLHFKNGQGCHRDRRKSKQLLKENLKQLIDEVKAKMPSMTTLFICASAAGGTGSGMLAAVSKILAEELRINICLVTVLPDNSESYQAFANVVELFKEIEQLDCIGAVFVLDNAKNQDKLKINDIFFTHLHTILMNENGGNYGCLDRSEIDKLLSVPGMAVIAKVLFKNDAVLKNAFEKTMHEPIDFLTVWNKEDSSRRFARMTDIHPMKNFNNLLKLIRANVTNELLFEWRNKILLDSVEYPLVNKNLLSSFDTVKMLCNQILDYKQFFNELILYSDQKLYTTDKQCKYWYLDNNILLDASGELQSAYALNPDVFVLQRCEKVLDHSKWKIINIPVNTTSSGKEKILNFYDVVNDDIKKYGDDILVIGKKNEMDLIKVPDKNKGYFGNVTGSNKWYNKRNVAIIQTHNLTDVDYILKYLHYGKGIFEDKLNLGTTSSGRKSKRIYSFNDKRLEEIRTKWIASEIYQAIKRVNRNMQYDSEVLIYINNEKVIELLKSQMRNCQVSVTEPIKRSKRRFI